MTRNEVLALSQAMQTLTMTQGYTYLMKHIQDEITDGWDKFIDLPVDKKTSKQAFYCQAKYKVLKDLLEWIEDSIKRGNEVEMEAITR